MSGLSGIGGEDRERRCASLLNVLRAGTGREAVGAGAVRFSICLLYNENIDYSRCGLAKRWNGLRKDFSAVNQRWDVLSDGGKLKHGALEVRHHQLLVVCGNN